jgi:thiosulfate/3-mercaptopyruvate sulfurtransferase
MWSTLCLLFLVAPAAEDAKPARYPRADLLLEAADLLKGEILNKFTILDVRPKDQFTMGHVPGSVWVDHASWSKDFAAKQDPETWAKHIGGLGIEEDTPVVVYDDNMSKDAARVWWILRYWGIRDVRLLNGSWPAWRAAGGPAVRALPPTVPAEVKLTPQTGRLAVREQLEKALKDKPPQIIDARSADEHCGVASTARRNGAIPGSIHREWKDVLDPKSGRFKSPDELMRIFRESSIDLQRPSVTYCQSGGRAAVMAFALELMGAKDVRNYYRSWAEWGNAEDTPVVKPEPKKKPGTPQK